MLTHCFLTNMENEKRDMFFQSAFDNHKRQIQRTHQMRYEVDLYAFFSSGPVFFPTWFSSMIIFLRGAAEKCASQRLALHSIHPVNAARKYFHHDVIAFKPEQEYSSSDRTEHSFQRLLISEKDHKQAARTQYTVASHRNAFEDVCACCQDHRNQ